MVAEGKQGRGPVIVTRALRSTRARQTDAYVISHWHWH
jgi:hypothetical protein